MAQREYNVVEIVDVLRKYLAGDSIRQITQSTDMDRNTERKSIRNAEENGFDMEFADDLDEMAFLIFRAVYPDRRHSESKNDNWHHVSRCRPRDHPW